MTFPQEDDPPTAPNTDPKDPGIYLPSDEPIHVPTDPPVHVPTDVPFDPPGDVPPSDDDPSPTPRPTTLPE